MQRSDLKHNTVSKQDLVDTSLIRADRAQLQ